MESKVENIVAGGERGEGGREERKGGREGRRHEGTIFEVRKDNCRIHSCVSHSLIQRHLAHLQ